MHFVVKSFLFWLLDCKEGLQNLKFIHLEYFRPQGRIKHWPFLRNLNFLRYIEWEKALLLTTEGEKTTLECLNVIFCVFFPINRGYIGSMKVVSDFRFGHRKCLFWSERKHWKWLLLALKAILIFFTPLMNISWRDFLCHYHFHHHQHHHWRQPFSLPCPDREKAIAGQSQI